MQWLALLTRLGNLDNVTELAGLAIDLYAVVQVFFESSSVKNPISFWFREVDYELVVGLGNFGTRSFRLLSPKK